MSMCMCYIKPPYLGSEVDSFILEKKTKDKINVSVCEIDR